MTAQHQTGEVINERYQIEALLGRGGMGLTYRAMDLPTQQLVAVKALSLRRLQNWKALELFEREAKVLAQLQHPAIPQYIDHFQVDTTGDRGFYLVQQLAPGQSLLEWIEQGWRPTESEVKLIARQILAVLVYLQWFTPAVIHRDIKPQNVIRQADGQLLLVDFGAVQDVYRHTVGGGSTIVGTFGYMAPEQFRGQANLTTDLYGLGTTLLFLLTGDSPAELPLRQLKINFRPAVKLSRPFARWLEGLIEPAWEARPASAQVALTWLQDGSFARKSALAVEQNLVHIEEAADAIALTVLPSGFPHGRSLRLMALFVIGSGLLVGLLLLLLGNNLIFVNFGVSLMFLLVLLGYGITAEQVFQKVILDRISLVTLQLAPQGFTFERRGGSWRRRIGKQIPAGVTCHYGLSAAKGIWGRRLVFFVSVTQPSRPSDTQNPNADAESASANPFSPGRVYKRDRCSFGSTLSPTAQEQVVERVNAYITATPLSPVTQHPVTQMASSGNFDGTFVSIPSTDKTWFIRPSMPDSVLGRVIFIVGWTIIGLIVGGFLLILIPALILLIVLVLGSML